MQVASQTNPVYFVMVDFDTTVWNNECLLEAVAWATRLFAHEKNMWLAFHVSIEDENGNTVWCADSKAVK